MKTLRWTWQQTKGIRGALSVSFVAGLLRVASSLVFVWASRNLIDLVTRRPLEESSLVWKWGILLIVLQVVSIGSSALGSWLSTQSDIRFRNRLRSRLYVRVLEGRYPDTLRWHSGDIVSRLTEDIRLLSDALCHKLPDLLIMAVMFAGSFGFLYSMSPVLALCLLAIVPLCLLLSRLYVKRMRVLTAELRQEEAAVQSDVQEGVQHLVLVKSMQGSGFLSSSLADLQGTLYGTILQRTRLSLFSRTLLSLGFSGGYLTAFLWGGWHLYSGSITFGTMTAFLQLVGRIQSPMASIAGYIPALVQSLASIDRLIQIDELPPETAMPGGLAGSLVSGPVAGAAVSGASILVSGSSAPGSGLVSGALSADRPLGLRVSGLEFAYEDQTEPVFRDFCFDFQPGRVTAIVGETGIGKTTLTRLMLGLLQPTKGRVELYDGEHTLEVSADTRPYFAYVPQGNSLVCDTVRRNLLMARPEATEAELWEALHVASADFVRELPKGLDSVCGERGARLSEGQAQRIAIARAVLRGSRILLLDEFNSALDPQTASNVLSSLLHTGHGRTVILITHRPEVLSSCDAVLRL